MLGLFQRVNRSTDKRKGALLRPSGCVESKDTGVNYTYNIPEGYALEQLGDIVLITPYKETKTEEGA